jgi:hypothetical protein
MALITRWRPQHWAPAPAQKETALRLADPFVGSRARTLSDGTTDLRTIQDREVRRYVILQNGTATLIESRPTSRVYRHMKVARPVAQVMALAAIVWLIVSQAVHFHEGTLGWAAAAVFVSFVGLFASEVVMNREIEPPDEQWQRIGGSDF